MSAFISTPFSRGFAKMLSISEDDRWIKAKEVQSYNMYGQSAMFGIVILTSNPNGPKIFTPGTLKYIMTGYTYPLAFNLNENKDRSQKDVRSTVLWKPNIITDKDGKANMDFYTSDLPGTYQITLEGISTSGDITQITKRIEVR